MQIDANSNVALRCALRKAARVTGSGVDYPFVRVF